MPDLGPPTLRDIERYVHTLARAEHPGTDPAEARVCKARLTDWEREKPSLRAAVIRVTAALEGGPQPQPQGGREPSAAVEELERTFAQFLRPEPGTPWWQRALRAVAGAAPHAGAIAEQYREALGTFETTPPPLAPGKYEVRLSENVHGEVTVVMRAHPQDVASAARREKLLDVVRKRLHRRAA